MLKMNSSFSKFFKNEKKQIYFQNIRTIQGLSLFYVIAITLFAIVGTFTFGLTDRFISLLVVYTTMILLMAVLYFFSKYIIKNKINDLKLSIFMTYLSMFLSSAFIIIISAVIARTETRASFFLVFNILIPSLYMLSKKEILIFKVLSAIVFIVCSYVFRDPVFIDDMYLAIGSLIIGIPYNLLIYNIKMGDAFTKKQYSDQANLDTLTGLPNRRAFNSRIENLFLGKDYKSMAFIIVDADNFKQINDRRGHAYGDYAIKEMGKVLNQFSEENQLFASRIGGDEFVLIALDIQVLKTRRILDELLSIIKETKLEKNEKLEMSIGAFYFNEPGKYTPDEVFEKADEALYIVKENNKGQIKLIIDDFIS